MDEAKFNSAGSISPTFDPSNRKSKFTSISIQPTRNSKTTKLKPIGPSVTAKSFYFQKADSSIMDSIEENASVVSQSHQYGTDVATSQNENCDYVETQVFPDTQ